MAPVTVVTDTTHYLPPELLAAAGVEVVSLHVVRSSGQRREADIADLDAFYDELRAETDLPQTAAPSTGEFAEVYGPVLDAGGDVVSVHLSGGISGTVDAARIAARDAEAAHPGRRVAVVDSGSACGGLGLQVLAGASLAATGAGLDDVVARVEQARAEHRLWFGIDTLEFLRRGGRIGAAQAWLGGALKIKPVLDFQDGVLTPVDRVRTSGRLIARMGEFAAEMEAEGRTDWVVQHIQAPDAAAQVVAAGRAVLRSEPLWIGEVGPVIGAHVGPGLLGVGGLPPGLILRP